MAIDRDVFATKNEALRYTLRSDTIPNYTRLICVSMADWSTIIAQEKHPSLSESNTARHCVIREHSYFVHLLIVRTFCFAKCEYLS